LLIPKTNQHFDLSIVTLPAIMSKQLQFFPLL